MGRGDCWRCVLALQLCIAWASGCGDSADGAAPDAGAGGRDPLDGGPGDAGGRPPLGPGDNAAPVATVVTAAVEGGGDPRVGAVLVGSHTYSDEEDDPPAAPLLRWLRDGEPIDGAAGDHYDVTAQDSGATLHFEVTPTAGAGTTPGEAVRSNGLMIGNLAPVASEVVVSGGGRAVVGDVLSGSYLFADADGDAEGASVLRWLRDDAPIDGATGESYTVVAADSGADLAFEVTPVAATGTSHGSPVASPAVVVDNRPPEATDVLIVDDDGGDVLVGDVLRVSYAFVDADGDA